MQKRTNLARKEKKVGVIKEAMPLALIVHGWTYSTEKYKKIAKLLTNRGINTKILNVPGLTEKIDKPWKIGDYVEWLKQTIDIYSSSEAKRSREVLSANSSRFARRITKNNNKLILIAHSNGGRLALNFVVKYPNIVARLILIDSAGVYYNGLAIRSKRFVLKKIVKIGKKLSSSENFRNLLYKIIGESDYKNADPLMRQTMIKLINSDKMLNLNNVKVPTLIIWGEDDKVTPLSDGKLMHKLIKNSKLYVIKGAKHSPQFTHAKEVAEIIRKYLISNI